jgi:hypothetical protein
MEQTQRDLILDKPKQTNEDRQEVGSGTPRRSPQFSKHQLTPETLTSVLPLEPTVSASPATLMPPEAPGSPEKAKPTIGTNTLVIEKDPMIGA